MEVKGSLGGGEVLRPGGGDPLFEDRKKRNMGGGNKEGREAIRIGPEKSQYKKKEKGSELGASIGLARKRSPLWMDLEVGKKKKN